MINYENALFLGMFLINVWAITTILLQRTRLATQQHHITQNMIALKQAEKILKGRKNA